MYMSQEVGRPFSKVNTSQLAASRDDSDIYITSLKKCIKKYGRQLSIPYVLHDKGLKVEDGITYLPLYMTPLL
jgi:hypothetical protein